MTYFFTSMSLGRIMGIDIGFKGLNSMKRYIAAFGLGVLLLSAAVSVRADGAEEMTRLLKGGDSAATSTAPSHSHLGDTNAIRLSPDRTKVLRLRENAASVVVANPAHASVILDSPKLLILMPREPGTTSFTVLNAEGKVLLERNIIVSAVQPQYVRIRRVCGKDSNCAPSNYYYCPDGCFEVTPVANEGNADIPEVQGGAPAAAPVAGTAPAADGMIVEETEGPMIVDETIDEEIEQPADNSGADNEVPEGQ